MKKFKFVRTIDPKKSSLTEIITDYIPTGWNRIFAESTNERKTIARLVTEKEAEITIFPAKENIYRAFDLVKPEEVKVVLIGQDPYPNYHRDKISPRAQGLSFAIKEDDQIPVSLNNIEKELFKEGFAKSDNPAKRILRWPEEGVLLLNLALTVEEGQPNSHRNYWRPFTILTIEALLKMKRELIFILWGNEAKALKNTILRAGGIVLEGAHPAARGGLHFGHNNFKEANQLLATPINW